MIGFAKHMNKKHVSSVGHSSKLIESSSGYAAILDVISLDACLPLGKMNPFMMTMQKLSSNNILMQ